MSGLILPESVAEERESAAMAEATEKALQRYQASLAAAYRAGYELATRTPRRLQVNLNVAANFWRWYHEVVEGAG